MPTAADNQCPPWHSGGLAAPCPADWGSPAGSLSLSPWAWGVGLTAAADSNDLLSLKLVGGDDVCNGHDLLSVNRKEVLGDVLREKDRNRLTHEG